MVAYEELFRSRLTGPPDVTPHRRFTRVRYPLAEHTLDVALWREPLQTVVAAPCRALDGFVLNLRHDGRGGGLDIGDPDFRGTYTVHTSDPGLARELLDAKTRALIAFTGHVAMPTRSRDRCYSYTIAEGFVSASSATFDDHADALEDTIIAVDALARRPDAIAAVWLETADALGAEVRGAGWSVAGDLILMVPSATGAYTVGIAPHRWSDGGRELATRVVDDRQAVAWIDTVIPTPAQIRWAVNELAGRRAGGPYR